MFISRTIYVDEEKEQKTLVCYKIPSTFMDQTDASVQNRAIVLEPRPMPDAVSPDLRWTARDWTFDVARCHINEGTLYAKNLIARAALYRYGTPPIVQRSNRGSYAPLFGRYDVLCVPTQMNFDGRWQRSDPGDAKFWAFHVCAPDVSARPHNVREGDDGEALSVRLPICGSFFSTTQKLFRSRYLEETRRTTKIVVRAMKCHGVTDAVWFPLGMGAFMRHLPTNDATFKDEREMRLLRRDVAATMLNELSSGGFVVHLCIVLSNEHREPSDNCMAFLEALNSGCGRNVVLRFNRDATDLAQELCRDDKRVVGFVNGANARSLGNGWRSDGAETAIDENYTRRSIAAAIFAMVADPWSHAEGAEKVKAKAYAEEHPDRFREQLCKLGVICVEDLDALL